MFRMKQITAKVCVTNPMVEGYYGECNSEETRMNRMLRGGGNNSAHGKDEISGVDASIFDEE